LFLLYDWLQPKAETGTSLQGAVANMPLPHVVASQHPPPPPPQPAQGNIVITCYLYDNDHWTAITVNPFDAHCCQIL